MQCETCKIEMKVENIKDDKLTFVCPKCKTIKVVETKDIKPSK